MWSPVSIEPRPLMNLWIPVQYSSFWTNLAFACKTETLVSLYIHALLILTKSSNSKNQVVHVQKFKDLLSSTWQVESLNKREQLKDYTCNNQLVSNIYIENTDLMLL